MFIISIAVHNTITEQQYDAMFPKHVEWFQKYYQQKKFVVLGPYTDTEAHSGVIITADMSREALEEILAEDSFYPNSADYQIREFDGKLSYLDTDK